MDARKPRQARSSVALRRTLAVMVVAIAAGAPLTAPVSGASTAYAAHANANPSPPLSEHEWIWPAETFRIAEPFVQPAHAYAPGHRGVDLDLLGTTAVRSPAPGVIAFAGAVAGRELLTIDHGDGLVTTLEPMQTDLVPGAAVNGGDALGTLAVGGHSALGTLHFGVRLNGEYINPLLLLGGVPRAILLPCCE